MQSRCLVFFCSYIKERTLSHRVALIDVFFETVSQKRLNRPWLIFTELCYLTGANLTFDRELEFKLSRECTNGLASEKARRVVRNRFHKINNTLCQRYARVKNDFHTCTCVSWYFQGMRCFRIFRSMIFGGMYELHAYRFPELRKHRALRNEISDE